MYLLAQTDEYVENLTRLVAKHKIETRRKKKKLQKEIERVGLQEPYLHKRSVRDQSKINELLTQKLSTWTYSVLICVHFLTHNS